MKKTLTAISNPILRRMYARAGACLLLGTLAASVSAADLQIQDGVVVKFGDDAGMVVHDRLHTGRHVVLTSVDDDSVAGQTGQIEGAPIAGSWRGVRIEDSVAPANLGIDRLEIRYAGASSSAALQIAKSYALSFLKITNSVLGLRVLGGASPTLDGFTLTGNQTGLQSDEHSAPTLTNSEFVQNMLDGVANATPDAIVQAKHAWWGAASGPHDPVGNPSGTGDAVTTGVAYTPFNTKAPLIDCSIAVADGNYTVSTPTVALALECRNAGQYRLSESSTFTSSFQALSPPFTYNVTASSTTLYVEYRVDASATSTVVAQLSQPILYTPGLPTVSITSPAPNATLAIDNVVVTADASDATGIDHVDFYFDDVLVGTDTTAPYEMYVPFGELADGDYPIRVVATNVGTQTADAQTTIHLQRGGTGSGAPVVAITTPANNATVTGNTLIAATVTGDDITHVDFYQDDLTPIASIDAPGPYQTVWNIQGLPTQQNYDITVVATNGSGQTGEDTVTVYLDPTAPDTAGPSIANVLLGSATVADGMTVTAPGLLTFDISDDSGVNASSIQITLNGSVITGGGLNNGRYSTLLDFSNLPAGDCCTLAVYAADTLGNPTAESWHLNVQIPAPAAPTILVPAASLNTTVATFAVSGLAEPNSAVKLYLGGSLLVGQATTLFNGTFSATATLSDAGGILPPGTYQLTATATSGRGTSPASAPVAITYAPPPPSVVITSPPEHAVIEDDIDVTASVVDPSGLQSVQLTVDGVQVGNVLTAAPFTWHWNAGDASVEATDHELEVVAINNVGVPASATREVTVQHTPPPPPPVQTPYTGVVDSVSPATSFGEQTITITGRAIDRQSPPQAVPNALLKLVLQIDSFQRRINVVAGADGAFTYLFHPQASDAGRYDVAAIHPDETGFTSQQNFTINRLSVTPTLIHLNAARTVPTPVHITVKASAGSGVSDVHLEYDTLPQNISVQLPPAVNLQTGQSASLDAIVTAAIGAGEQGTLTFTVKSGSDVRGTVAVSYLLSDPQPALLPQPSSIATGVAPGGAITASTQLSNRGFLAATDVSITLTDSDGNAPPPWISLTSPTSVALLDVGASMPIDITASPPAGTANGIYALKVHVAATNIANGDMFLWATIAVNDSGVGSVEFHAMDIYTNTCVPDESGTCPSGGPTVPGLANASIRVQNELCTVGSGTTVCESTVTKSGVTGADGHVTIDELPPGHYRYVATAPSHASASGFFTVRPDVTWFEEPFLDYELVSFEWSVTETTIQDQYDVTLTATYQTQVPAPVVLIQPMSINLPDMQSGEEVSGEITITNYGLVRADHVVFTPPSLPPPNGDGYFTIEFLGEVPESLEARQRVTLAYKVTAVSALPDDLNGANEFQQALGIAKSGGTCHAYTAPMNLKYDFTCAAGSTRNGSATAGFNKAYGTTCGGSSPGSYSWVGGGGYVTWPGGSGGPLGGQPMANVPGCTPDCKTCCHKGNQPGGGQ